MKLFIKFLCCKEFFVGLILIIFFSSISRAGFDDRTNKSLETRLHNIFEKHYSREVIDADWFKVIESVQEQTYQVKKGDTLWGISTVYFGDGNYWSKLWSVNKNITNPHLIYNGDRIQFTTGSFTQAPSISVTKVSDGADAVPLAASGAVTSSSDELAKVDQADKEDLAEINAKSGVVESPSDLPDFFRPPSLNLRRAENITSIEPRMKPVPVTDMTIVQEVMSEAPKELCKIKSVGLNRILASESSLVILTCKVHSPDLGSVMSIVDPNIEEIEGGKIVKILGVLKVTQKIEEGQYEAVVTQQFNAITIKSLTTNHLPLQANIENTGDKKEIPIKILNADDKSIWTTGDYVFMKTLGTGDANIGDVLNFNNRYDYNINSFQKAASVKIVSSNLPYVTGVVLTDSNEIREDSVSAPVQSESWFF